MRLWSRTRHAKPERPDDATPVVLPVDRALARDTGDAVADQVIRLAHDAPVVVDVTAVPSFDSDGAAALLEVQERLGADRVSIVGFRQAANRLAAAETVEADAAEPSLESSVEHGWVVRRLRNLAVVQPADGEQLSTDEIEPVLALALASDVAIVVADLRHTSGLTPAGLQALTFASSTAAVQGQELLVVNVGPDDAETLRTAGLSATTYVAPEPPPS